MNTAFHTVIAASDNERRDLFFETASHLDKDFWVCWTLDTHFNEKPKGNPRLLLKGGTSLSKAFRLVAWFSEDIDVAVFRDDLEFNADIAELGAISGKKRRALLDAIRTFCQSYINGPLIKQFSDSAVAAIPSGRFQLQVNPDDTKGQRLLFWYPTFIARLGDYIRSAIKIESVVRLRIDPNTAAIVRSYVIDDLPHLDLAVAKVMTVKPEHTFGTWL